MVNNSCTTSCVKTHLSCDFKEKSLSVIRVKQKMPEIQAFFILSDL